MSKRYILIQIVYSLEKINGKYVQLKLTKYQIKLALLSYLCWSSIL